MNYKKSYFNLHLFVVTQTILIVISLCHSDSIYSLENKQPFIDVDSKFIEIIKYYEEGEVDSDLVIKAVPNIFNYQFDTKNRHKQAENFFQNEQQIIQEDVLDCVNYSADGYSKKTLKIQIYQYFENPFDLSVQNFFIIISDFTTKDEENKLHKSTIQ
ncbi:hypothetical protein PPERSA_03490 [Pseudocohnilembus persalinus]|uniref:Uncharacterized protein n=1 Tax=Pseudocohnilembus persalinus TaxID=266149 RepID=A0A0V0QBU6_PSEPJ|nr:hypothetical protein PPERSA_03490 [Pseudocohnilembus persalinus]|eukprot:KRW99689.1 hypothetical protein PPERSA_03490 [Pseudocohnilembus persalinus]